MQTISMKIQTKPMRLTAKPYARTSTYTYTGTANEYPCLLTLRDLSNITLDFVSGFFFTSPKNYTVPLIQSTIYDLDERLMKEAEEASGQCVKYVGNNEARLVSYFVRWKKALYNKKLLTAFYQAAKNNMRIEVTDEDVSFEGTEIRASAAKKLAERAACVQIAHGMMPSSESISTALVQMKCLTIDNYTVRLRVALSRSEKKIKLKIVS